MTLNNKKILDIIQLFKKNQNNMSLEEIFNTFQIITDSKVQDVCQTIKSITFMIENKIIVSKGGNKLCLNYKNLK